MADFSFTHPEEPDSAMVPLTTLQRWFLEHRTWINPHHWNITFLLETEQPVEQEIFYQTIHYLFQHHDGLRLYFRQEQKQWQAFVTKLDDILPVLWIDLSTQSELEQKHAIESTAAQLQKSLNIHEGRLIQIAYFHLGLQRSGRILWISHHLIMDAFSCLIILQDFEIIYRQLKTKQNPQPLLKTTSLQQWGLCLEAYIASQEMRQEFENYWLQLPWDELVPVSVDYPEEKEKDTNASATSLTVSLDVTHTRAFYRQVHRLQTEVMSVFLMVLVEAFKLWQGITILYVDVVDHGRATSFHDINLLRTVGQIAIGRRYLLKQGGTSQPIDALKSIEKQLSNAPNNGVGFDWLLYLSKDQEIVDKLLAVPPLEVLFNYLGRQTTQADTNATTSLFKMAQESTGSTEDPRERREIPLRFTVSTLDNELKIECEYSNVVYKKATIENLLQHYIHTLNLFIDIQT